MLSGVPIGVTKMAPRGDGVFLKVAIRARGWIVEDAAHGERTGIGGGWLFALIVRMPPGASYGPTW